MKFLSRGIGLERLTPEGYDAAITKVVADAYLDVFVPGLLEPRTRLRRELRDAFDGHDLGGELREHRCLVPRAGPDVEYALRPS